MLSALLRLSNSAGRLALLTLLVGLSCQPGLGHPIMAEHFAFAFTQRDLKTISSLSSPSFRKAVWDRLTPSEFGPVAALMAHGKAVDIVDTQFHDTEAIIQLRVRGTRQQFRLYAIYQDDDWFADDVLREVAPLEYISMRRQSEAILAVRDFRRALITADPRALCSASSDTFCKEVWAKIDADLLARLRGFLAFAQASLDGSLGDVFQAQDGSTACRIPAGNGQTTVYFVPRNSVLAIDDFALPGEAKSAATRLGQAVQLHEWNAP